MGRTVNAASRRPAYHIVLDVIACIACILSLASCALTGKGSSPATNPSISVTPSLVSFGNVKIKTQTSQTLRLSNPGTKDLVISQATISGEGFSAVGTDRATDGGCGYEHELHGSVSAHDNRNCFSEHFD